MGGRAEQRAISLMCRLVGCKKINSSASALLRGLWVLQPRTAGSLAAASLCVNDCDSALQMLPACLIAARKYTTRA